MKTMAAWVSISVELHEDARLVRWYLFGTTGDSCLDARFAAEDAEWRYPLMSWESEGGAL